MTVSNPFRQPLRRADVIAVLTKNDAAHAAYLNRLGQRDPELAERPHADWTK